MGNLAMLRVYCRTGRPDLEFPLIQEVVERSRRVLGLRHPQTLFYSGHLGALLSDMDRDESAISLLRHAKDGLMAVYGPQHPHTRTVARDLQKAQERRSPVSGDVPPTPRARKTARHNNNDESTMRKRSRFLD